ncbi:alpha/beta fold hydrolase [Streptomyces sp. SID8379]|uniref:alpha/beta fold hydrolase n=1 Tax=unclassified Streptomyces TaxID=2593676 RepID=UPI00038030C6|nr:MULTISPECIES: alpha/beta fold hydrolase [unclassified Streptomyces]MYW63588.1 alpha/beta fold hydrolase [Streptomyces sp. SID8379]
MTGNDRRAPVRAAVAGGALIPRRTPPGARAAVLFLHGGRADGRSPSRPWHLAALRMRPFVRSVAEALADDRVLLGQVRYRVRGWNGADADALHDAERALHELPRLVGDVPVVLVGHSMGGRAALAAARAPQVRAVLALAPWCPPGEPVAHLRGKDIVVLHGDRDRVTDPRESVAFVQRARAAGARAQARLVPGGDHAMLRDSAGWHRATASTVVDLLRP